MIKIFGSRFFFLFLLNTRGLILGMILISVRRITSHQRELKNLFSLILSEKMNTVIAIGNFSCNPKFKQGWTKKQKLIYEK